MKIRIFTNNDEYYAAFDNGFRGKSIVIFNNNIKAYHQRIMGIAIGNVLEDNRGSDSYTSSIIFYS